MSILELCIRLFLTIFILLIMARINGPKLISQMNFYDYIVGITIGSLAASTTIDSNLNLWNGLLAIVLYLASGILLSWFARSNLTLRRFLSGKPIMVIAHGKIQWKQLNRARMNMNELLSNLRYGGYFNISEIDYAVVEPTGKLSIQAKGSARFVKTDDLNILAADSPLLSNVIIDGEILYDNLNEFGKSKQWLMDELDHQGIQNLKSIGLATLNEQSALSVYLKDNNATNRSSFI